ncbi:uncharacterized protein LY89DRAFT_701936 [Mollisia scopiformis]|uniref:FAD-binding FR-type domain-containing protein n=1 Tax=Mollisia scopiformis TaxID=149040 RepID=A0A132B705_MOLSC|nr:uncharacterized protein LY89DRAFT_701936 [Mollisia scopiformis]KUJ08192.1 hypothetical protein LY89DRAFT_701936 [Mollisia scopiformis]
MQHAATSVLVIAYLNLILLLSILLFSRPIFRPLFRGHFETTMRFAGWTSLLLFWIKAGLFVSSRAGLEPVSKALLKSPSIWLMTVTTISILSTWFEVRKVPVKTYILSPHAIRLDFCASSPLGKAVPGTAVRISSSLLGEWYTFPTIAQPGQEGFSVIVANPKGWAAGLVANPPTELYIRGLPTTGFMRVIPLFRSMLLVVSGSGIAALLPQLYALDYAMLCGRDMRAMPRLRILWSAEDPEGVFGREVVELILRVDPWAVICDKRGLGRPDMLGTAWRLVRESGCEAVGVVGSQGLVGEVVYGLESRGVPAFGALWSS